MEKNVFLNETCLINYQNVNISPVKMQRCILTTQVLNLYKKSYPVVGVWSCQQSHMTISEMCRSKVDTQYGM